MSEHYITLVPEDPRFVPEAANQLRARHRFAEIVQANEIEIIVSEKIKFIDCGENFGRILCPSCHSEIAVAWWKQRMHDDYAKGFILAAYATPCCRIQCTLHELVYEWPQGFGRFALDARNPNIGKLEEKYKQELEEILGTRLRVIYQHI